jgi:hypothetical protein
MTKSDWVFAQPGSKRDEKSCPLSRQLSPKAATATAASELSCHLPPIRPDIGADGSGGFDSALLGEIQAAAAQSAYSSHSVPRAQGGGQSPAVTAAISGVWNHGAAFRVGALRHRAVQPMRYADAADRGPGRGEFFDCAVDTVERPAATQIFAFMNRFEQEPSFAPLWPLTKRA